MSDNPLVLSGLATDAVAERLRAGQTNTAEASTTRSTGQIVRANVFTRFNAVLVVMFVSIAAVGAFKDSIFIWVVVINAAVGIVQELRARRTLDSLRLVDTPVVRVVRDGVEQEIAVEAVVLDDVVLVERGDQVPVDAVVLRADGLEVDESLLTGEADTVAKPVGALLLSGSFVVAGTGAVRATAVGLHAYARTLTHQARQFGLARSELRVGTDQILRYVSIAIVPTAALLLWSQIRASESVASAVAGTVAGVVAMVPEGLVLLTSIALAAGMIRLGKHGVLTRELAAIEGLARVDVLCIDKTGTLTQPGMHLVEVVALDAEAPTIAAPLAALAAVEERPNASVAAIAAAYPEPPAWKATFVAHFSSARKWSGASFEAHGTWLLGAPEFLLVDGSESSSNVLRLAREASGTGHRMLLLASSDELVAADILPTGVRPVALVSLSEEIKANVKDTLAFFSRQGVTVKVISGDNPVTVAAVAKRAGVPGADRAVDARTLSSDPKLLADDLAAHAVFGRVTPEQKRTMVRSLQEAGHVVAMTGDGINDLLALKDADVGIAMGAGSAATRSVAQFVLVGDDFAALPPVVAEGRRVIANIERLANLFVTKSIYALLLALATGVARFPFPFLPRQLSVVGSLTIGIPSFFLALEPNEARARPGYVRRVLRFAIPSGLVAAAATFAAYADARTDNASLAEARTTATVVLFIVATWILSLPIRPLTGRRFVLIAATVGSFAAMLAFPGTRRYLELASPPSFTWVTAVPLVVVACVLLEVGARVAGRRRDDDPGRSVQDVHGPRPEHRDGGE